MSALALSAARHPGPPPEVLQRWEIVRVWRPDLHQPHDKFCICVDWDQRWFLYINSQPPQFRKAREAAVAVSNFEVACLTKPESFIDTVAIIEDVPEDQLDAAINDPQRRHGLLIKAVVERLRAAVAAHGALTPSQRAAILAE